MGTKDRIVVGTKTVCLVVVRIFVVVTIVGTEDVVVVRIFVVGLAGYIAEGDGKAARRIAATTRTLTRCVVLICMLVHADGTSTFLCKHIVVQESFTIVTHRHNAQKIVTDTRGFPVPFPTTTAPVLLTFHAASPISNAPTYKQTSHGFCEIMGA
jgi:hypothetical protein